MIDRTHLSRLGFWLLVLGLSFNGLSSFLGLAQAIYEPIIDNASIMASVAKRYGFLTILANDWIILIWIAVLSRWGILSFFRKPSVHASAAATILVVILYHHFLLSDGQWEKQGIDYYNNVVGHYFAPVIYLSWWLTTLPRPEVSWLKYPLIMAPAIGYPSYVLARGAVIGVYPYDNIDVSIHGYVYVLNYMGMIVVIFAVFCAFALAVNSALSWWSHRKSDSAA